MAKTTRSDGKPPWERKRPAGAKKTTLTPASRAKAKAWARKAGRKYPNLVDNMRAAAEQRSRKKSPARATRKTSAARKTSTKKPSATKRR